MAAKKQTYAQAMERLRKIVEQIESDELDIDALVDKIKEAQELIKYCNGKLFAVDTEIQQLLEQKSEK